MLKSIFASLFILGLVLQSSTSLADNSSESGYVDNDVMIEVTSTQAPATNVTNQNSITLGAPVSGPLASSYPMTPAVQTVHAEAAERADSSTRISLIPMVGASGFAGAWNYHVTNPYTFGLILETPMSRNFSFELEGSYARHGITYSSYSHNFDLFGIGGNGKLYLIRGVFSPYVGAGMMGLLFNGMSRGPSFPYQLYNQWIGSGQLMAGGDVAVSREVSIGLRGAYVQPLLNRPSTYHNGVVSFPGYEEAAAINTYFFRVMGAVRVAL